MSTYLIPHVLHIAEPNLFGKQLSDALTSHELEITACDFSEIPLKTESKEATYDYIIYNAVSSTAGLHFFVNESSWRALLQCAQRGESKLLFLLPDRIPVELKERFAITLNEITRIYPSAAFLIMPRPFFEVEWQNIYSQDMVIHIPNYGNSLSLARSQDIVNLVVRSLFSLRAYAHIQVVSGLTIMSDQLEYLFTRLGFPSIQMPANPNVELEYGSSEKTALHYQHDTFFTNFIKPLPKESEVILPKKSVELPRVVKVKRKPIEFKKYAIPVKHAFEKSITKSVETLSKVNLTIPKFQVLRKGWTKRFAFGVLLVTFLLIVPYILSLSAFSIAAYYSRQSKSSSSNLFLPLTRQLSHFSEAVSELYVSREILSHLYNDSLGLSKISERLFDVAEEKAIKNASTDTFFKDSFSGKEFEVSTHVVPLSFSYDSIYANSGFVISEIDSLSWTKPFVLFLLDRKYITLTMKNALFLKNLIFTLPELFGQGRPKTYAVILQNTKILRPTGGKIEALALITVDGGSVKTTEVLDVSASQTKFLGAVTAPFALEKYLHEENWEFVNANWDYSYPYAADKIAWFIDKEFDRKVDGVVAVSENALSTILEKGKRESPSESAAALSAGIQTFEFLMGSSKTNSRGLLWDLLSKKEILISIPVAGPQLEELGWSGSYEESFCDENCFVDKSGIIESNFGEANEHIKRDADISVTSTDGKLKRQVMYYIQNNGETDYKAYIRIVVPKNSTLFSAEVISQNSTESKALEVFGTRDQKEGGLYVEVQKDTTLGLSFVWEGTSSLDLNKDGSYIFSLYKQPGTSNYPVSIQVNFPIRNDFSTTSDEFLTNGGIFKYNTVLSNDLNPKINWKHQ